LKYKLNETFSYHDRETPNYTATDVIHAICAALNRYGELHNPPSSYITHLFHEEQGEIPIDVMQLQAYGIKTVCVRSIRTSNTKKPIYDEEDLILKLFDTIMK
jgi:hypothetical protein